MIEAPYWLRHARLAILDEQAIIPREKPMAMTHNEMGDAENEIERYQREAKELLRKAARRELYNAALVEAQANVRNLEIIVNA